LKLEWVLMIANIIITYKAIILTYTPYNQDLH
jgi:hypothetical protein